MWGGFFRKAGTSLPYYERSGVGVGGRNFPTFIIWLTPGFTKTLTGCIFETPSIVSVLIIVEGEGGVLRRESSGEPEVLPEGKGGRSGIWPLRKKIKLM